MIQTRKHLLHTCNLMEMSFSQSILPVPIIICRTPIAIKLEVSIRISKCHAGSEWR